MQLVNQTEHFGSDLYNSVYAFLLHPSIPTPHLSIESDMRRETISHTFMSSSRSLRDPKGPYCDIPKTAGAVAVPKTGFPAKAGVTEMIGVIGKFGVRGSSNAFG